VKGKSVLISVQGARYERLESLLEDAYSISANMQSQELLLDAIPKFKPDALIIDQDIKGTRPFEVFYDVLTKNHPDLRIIFYQEDFLDAIHEFIDGVREITPYMPSVSAPIPSNEEEEVAVASEAIVEEERAAGRTSIRNALRRILPGTEGSAFNDHDLMDDESDWELMAEAKNDIFNYERKVTVVTGASGGVGKTDVSINLAVHAANSDYKTVLCGFNLQNDDIAGRLGLSYLRGKKLSTAFELYTQNRLNISSLEDCLQDYRGLKVLVGIEKPEEAQEMDEEFFQQIVRILKANYDLVVLDTENNSFSPAYFSVISIADHIFVPCTTHNSVLEQLRDELHSWKDDFDIPLAKVDIIFNKKGEGGFINRDHIEKYTTREVVAEIPHSKDMLRGSEREEPAVLRTSMEASKIRKQFDKLLFRITGKKTKSSRFIKPRFTQLRKKVTGIAKGNKSN